MAGGRWPRSRAGTAPRRMSVDFLGWRQTPTLQLALLLCRRGFRFAAESGESNSPAGRLPRLQAKPALQLALLLCRGHFRFAAEPGISPTPAKAPRRPVDFLGCRQR